MSQFINSLSCVGVLMLTFITGMAFSAEPPTITSSQLEKAFATANLNTESANPAVKSGTCYAILIGHDIFENNPARIAEYSIEDTRLLKKHLLANGVSGGNIACMTSEQSEFYLRPTRNNIFSMLRLVAKNAEEHDCIIVLISGMGCRVGGETCFLPKGATYGSAGDWITDSEIRRILMRSAAKKTLLIELVNRKSAGNVSLSQITTAGLPENAASVTSMSQEPEVRIHVTINSCSENGFADESLESKNDLFLATLLTLVKSESGSPLNDFVATFPSVRDEVLKKTADREGGPQVPQMRIWKRDEPQPQ